MIENIRQAGCCRQSKFDNFHCKPLWIPGSATRPRNDGGYKKHPPSSSTGINTSWRLSAFEVSEVARDPAYLPIPVPHRIFAAAPAKLLGQSVSILRRRLARRSLFQRPLRCWRQHFTQ